MSTRTGRSKLPAVGGEAVQGDKPTDTTGLPRAQGYGLSHWQETVQNHPLLDHRTTEDLPSHAEVVIIGSGISGTLAALNLLQSSKPPKSVIIVEARELCSGATGRNAGHCKPDQWRGFTKWKAAFGTEQALKILKNEQQTWEALVSYVRQHNVDCDLWVGKTLDVMMSDDVAEAAAKNMEAFKRAGGDASRISIELDPVKAEKLSRLKGARAVYSWNASTLHPWKLVAYVVQQCLDLGLNLQTWTPVTSVTGNPGEWSVNTDRGTIITPTVIHATNAYAGVLLPEFKGPLYPVPHMCNKVIPPKSHSGSKALKNSYAVITSKGLFSVNPRAAGDGAVLFGGSNPNQPELMKYVNADQKNRGTDDSLVNFEPVTKAVRQLGREKLQWDGPAKDGRGQHVRYDRSWSGIIGNSLDHVPFIGAVPGKPGQWMSCGHNGHGMARIFTASPALVKIIQGATWEEAGLPDSFLVTPERLRRLQEQAKVKAKL